MFHLILIAAGSPRFTVDQLGIGFHGQVLGIVDNLVGQTVDFLHHVQATLGIVNGFQLKSGLADGVDANTIAQFLLAFGLAAGDTAAKVY